MSTYNKSHKNYYLKTKEEGAQSYCLRGDKEFIGMMKEAANRLRAEKRLETKPLTNYIKNSAWVE